MEAIEQVAAGIVCTVTLASPPGAAPVTDMNSTVGVASGARGVFGEGATLREGAGVGATVSETPGGVGVGFAEGTVG